MRGIRLTEGLAVKKHAFIIAALALTGIWSSTASAKPTWDEFMASKSALVRRSTAEQNRKCLASPYTHRVRFTRGETEPRVLVSYVFGRSENREGAEWIRNEPVFDREHFEAWDGKYPHHYKTVRQRVFPNAKHRLINFPAWMTGRYTDRGYDLVGVPREGVYEYTVESDYGDRVYSCRRLLQLIPS